MNVYELLFVITLLVGVSITLFKLYNLMLQGELYRRDGVFKWQMAVMGFIIFLLAWLFVLVITLANPEVILYFTLLKVFNIFLVVNVLVLIIEIIFGIRDAALKTIKGSYNGLRMNRDKRV